jgi:hypothetical protein
MAPYRINPDCTAFLGAFSRTQLLTGILSLARSTKFWDELREKNPSWLAAPWVISKTSYSKESLSFDSDSFLLKAQRKPTIRREGARALTYYGRFLESVIRTNQE